MLAVKRRRSPGVVNWLDDYHIVILILTHITFLIGHRLAAAVSAVVYLVGDVLLNVQRSIGTGMSGAFLGVSGLGLFIGLLVSLVVPQSQK